MVMNADGTNRLTLIKEDKLLQNSQPSWSPDGSQLVFVRDDGFYQGWIYVVNKDGSNLHQVVELSNYSFAGPVWSPAPLGDGQYKILFSDQLVPGGQSDLFLVNLDGTGLVNLTNTPETEFYPTWNPTATRFAAQVYGAAPEPDIVVYDVAGVDGVFTATPSINLTDAGPLKDARVYEVDWANTQDKIVLSARLPNDINNSDLWVIDLADPANPVRLTQTSGAGEITPSWSADDSKIVYRRNAPRNSKIKSGMFAINADGSGATGDSYPADGTMPDWRRCCPTCVVMCAP
jgi:TolB protein